jgi:hypothetical protein
MSDYKGKHPNRIKSVTGLNVTPAAVRVVTNCGKKYTITARQSKGWYPKTGEDVSKYVTP